MSAFTKELSEDWHFQRLLQWVLLDTNSARMGQLVGTVFQGMLLDLQALAEELGNGYDPHLLAVSIMSLILLPFEAGTASRLLPGHKAHHERAVVLAHHILRLLRHGVEHAPQEKHGVAVT